MDSHFDRYKPQDADTKDTLEFKLRHCIQDAKSNERYIQRYTPLIQALQDIIQDMIDDDKPDSRDG